MQTLTQTLERLSSIVESRYPHLNYGGCCLFAALVGEQLQRRGTRCEGKSLLDDQYRFAPKESRPKLWKARRAVADPSNTNAWQNHGICFSHMFLRIRLDTGKWVLYDSRGIQPDSNEFHTLARVRIVQPGRWRIRELQMMGDEPGNWNDTWNRKELPSLKRLIERVFAEAYNGYTDMEYVVR